MLVGVRNLAPEASEHQYRGYHDDQTEAKNCKEDAHPMTKGYGVWRSRIKGSNSGASQGFFQPLIFWSLYWSVLILPCIGKFNCWHLRDVLFVCFLRYLWQLYLNRIKYFFLIEEYANDLRVSDYFFASGALQWEENEPLMMRTFFKRKKATTKTLQREGNEEMPQHLTKPNLCGVANLEFVGVSFHFWILKKDGQAFFDG